MPVREKAVQRGIRAFFSLQPNKDASVVFNSITDVARVNGVTISQGDFDQIADLADSVYERVIDSIDWKRVMLEASARHSALHMTDETQMDDVCAECVREALLAPRWQNWEEAPDVERLWPRLRSTS
jgi:hypothetical protein